LDTTSSRPRLSVTSDGRGVVAHVDARLLADLVDATGLTGAFSEALAGLRQRRGGHDPDRVAADVAVMLADGGETISDLAVLRDQAKLFGPVASPATAWRVLDAIDEQALARLRAARAAARETAWAQHAETRGEFPEAKAAGRVIPRLVLGIDASIVICHSEKHCPDRPPTDQRSRHRPPTTRETRRTRPPRRARRMPTPRPQPTQPITLIQPVRSGPSCRVGGWRGFM
jgi:hypothetical protein